MALLVSINNNNKVIERTHRPGMIMALAQKQFSFKQVKYTKNAIKALPKCLSIVCQKLFEYLFWAKKPNLPIDVFLYFKSLKTLTNQIHSMAKKEEKKR